jgi:hypothetical protein
MHVDDPSAVLAEVQRCVAPEGLVTVFEPDWTGFRVKSIVRNDSASWMSFVRHPDIGARLWGFLEESGFEVLDRAS